MTVRLEKAEASSGIEVPKEGNWSKPMYGITSCEDPNF